MILFLSACSAPTANAPATVIPLSPTLPVIVSETSTPESLPEVTLTPESLSPESFTCWTENVKDGCLGLVERPGMEIADKLYAGWFSGPSYQEFWKDTLGTDGVPSEAEVRAWVEANGWHIPLKSPSGIDFPWLQAESANAKGQLNARFAPLDNATAQRLGYIDFSQGIRTMFFDQNTWKENAGGVQDEFRRLWELNGDSWLIFGGTDLDSASEVYGYWLDESGVPVFVAGSTTIYEYSISQGTDKYTLSGTRADNAALVSAEVEGVIRVISSMTNAEIYDPKNGVRLRFSQNPGARDILKDYGYFLRDNSWFVTAEDEAAVVDFGLANLPLYQLDTVRTFREMG